MIQSRQHLLGRVELLNNIKKQKNERAVLSLWFPRYSENAWRISFRSIFCHITNSEQKRTSFLKNGEMPVKWLEMFKFKKQYDKEIEEAEAERLNPDLSIYSPGLISSNKSC